MSVLYFLLCHIPSKGIFANVKSGQISKDILIAHQMISQLFSHYEIECVINIYGT